jgi:hypothetical protein
MRFVIALPTYLGGAMDDYRWERDRQQREIEKQTGGYDADTQFYRDQGGKPALTLKDWMKSQALGPAEQAARTAPVTKDVHVPGAGWEDDTPDWAKTGRFVIALRN